MVYYSIFITSVCFYLFFRNKRLKNKLRLDNGLIARNREALLKLALEDYNNGGISKKELGYFSHVCHISFRDWMDSVPMDRADYHITMQRTDKLFWESYKLTPDFRIPPEIVYALYKNYVQRGFEINPKYFEDPQFTSRNDRQCSSPGR